MKDKIEVIKKLSKNINLLYVEDNIGLCKNMKKLLERMFDNILIANDGEEGYKKFIEYEPKIVITDINMPIMNGFEMLEKIQASEPESKMIILSANDEKKDLHTAIDLGVFRYLSKPAKVPALVEAMHDTVLSIHKDENRRIFLNQLQNIFNYQLTTNWQWLLCRVTCCSETHFTLNKTMFFFDRIPDLRSCRKYN